MGHFQHPGEGVTEEAWPEESPLIDAYRDNRLKTAIGYISTKDSALSAIK